MKSKTLLSLVFLLSFLSSCAQKGSKIENSITFLLATDDIGLTYKDTSTSTLSMYFKMELSTILDEAKKERGSLLTVYIRKTEMVSAKAIDGFKNLLAEKKINNYFIQDLNDSDVKLFQLAVERFQPPETVTIKTPNTVTSSEFSKEPALYIEMSAKNEISYKIDSIEHNVVYNKLKQNDTATLKKFVSNYKSIVNGRKVIVYIIGDDDAGYEPFEQIINALKANEIFTYKLVTKKYKP
jgi:biopolymer transport protein ExbD